MTVEYVVLGGVLVVMGAVQIWLRYGPWAKEQREAAAKAGRKRPGRVDEDGCGSGAGEDAVSVAEPALEGPVTAEEPIEAATVTAERSTKLWNTWTAILGPLAIGFGLVLVILGALGF